MGLDPDAVQKIVYESPRVDLQNTSGVGYHGIRDHSQPSIRHLVAELSCGKPADVPLDADCHERFVAPSVARARTATCLHAALCHIACARMVGDPTQKEAGHTVAPPVLHQMVCCTQIPHCHEG